MVTILAAVLGIGTGISSALAQQPDRQPVSWGEIAPPALIEGLPDLRPAAPLEFSRAWLARMQAVHTRRLELMATGALDGLTPAEAAAQGAALAGTLRVPVLPLLYRNQRAPFDVALLRDRLFGPTRGDTVSFAGYWDEVSGGLLKVEGDVAPWLTLPHEARHYLRREDYGWSRFGRIADLRREALALADRVLDFRSFDNDGPDGVPDSGDDDGFVDFVAFVYAVPCPGDGREGGIWPHRAAMPPIATADTSRATGKPLRVADYVILPAVDQQGCGPLHVGVLAHETGHALGLPDLYDYDGSSQGVGGWGLMGTGSHAAQFSPAHLDAWSKEQLGWVQVSWLEDTTSLTLPPVERMPQVYRIDEGAGSQRYLLLENRQRLGSDKYLSGSGLLVWEVDPERGELGAWNNDERRPAVRLIEADGRADLVRGRRADGGDPFPGTRGENRFSTSFGGGLELQDIKADSAGDVVASVQATGDRVLRPATGSLRLTAVQGGGLVHYPVAVERPLGFDVTYAVHTSAPWLSAEAATDSLRLAADPGSLAPGIYSDTARLVDSRGLPLGDVLVSFHVAARGYGQIVATELPWSWGLAAHHGRLLQASYGWDQLGLRPRPRVLQLIEGSTHPQTLARLPADALYAPVIDRESGDAYVLARARNENLLYRVGRDGSAELVAAGIGEEPAYGVALLPDGQVLVADWSGTIHRVSPTGETSLYTRLGTNVYQIATDAAGNLFAAAYDGNVLRFTPAGELSVLETGFGSGRLVAVATQQDGSVLAAERGGEGRIVRLAPDGGLELLFRGDGADYYGVATDEEFIYALDLSVRQLIRIALPERRSSPSLVAEQPPQH